LAFGALFSAISKFFPAQENPISMQEEHDNLEQKIWRYIEVTNLVWVWVKEYFRIKIQIQKDLKKISN